jgi:hypothetical protein
MEGRWQSYCRTGCWEPFDAPPGQAPNPAWKSCSITVDSEMRNPDTQEIPTPSAREAAPAWDLGHRKSLCTPRPGTGISQCSVLTVQNPRWPGSSEPGHLAFYSQEPCSSFQLQVGPQSMLGTTQFSAKGPSGGKINPDL